jgi:hypothetical protein
LAGFCFLPFSLPQLEERVSKFTTFTIELLAQQFDRRVAFSIGRVWKPKFPQTSNEGKGLQIQVTTSPK